jgi:hypothetical protein
VIHAGDAHATPALHPGRKVVNYFQLSKDRSIHMRFAVLTSLIFIVAIGTLAGCTSRDAIVSQTQRPSGQSSQSPSPSAPADNARRITAADAYKLYEKGNVVIIDTRTEAAYKESHIKGAILMPVNEVAAKANELPHDKTIVAYCT